MDGTTEKKHALKTKSALKILALLCMIMAFCPAFMVSCSGQTVKVSVFTAVEGVTMYGSRVVDPHPIIVICLIIPAAILLLLLTKKVLTQKDARIIGIGAVIDLVAWLAFWVGVSNLAKENYCECKITVWYVINLLALAGSIALSALILAHKINFDDELFPSNSNQSPQ